MRYTSPRLQHVAAIMFFCMAVTFAFSATADTVFYDGFESGNVSAGGWINEGTQMNYVYKVAGIWSVEFNSTDKLTKALNTSGYDTIILTYWRYGRNNYSWHYFYPEYTTNYGQSWTALESPSGNFGWTYKAFALPASCANNPYFGIRFRGSGASGSRWYVDEVTISGNVIRYPLTVNINGGGSVTLDPAQPGGGYPIGTVVTLTANANTGWWFAEWTGSLTGSSNPATITMNSAKTVTANFAKNEYSVTVQASGPGTVAKSPVSGPYYYGDTVTFTATPDSGCYFNGWSGSASGYDNPLSMTVTTDLNVTANFTSGPPPISSAQETWLRNMSNGIETYWPELTPPQALALYDKTEAYFDYLKDGHLPYGQVVDVWWDSHDRNSPVMYDTVGDSACWTGHYLAALACRYAATSDPATLQDIDDVLDAFDMLTQITGRSGVIARFGGLTSDPAYQLYYQNYGNGAYTGVAPWQNYTWLGWPSRDTYTGYMFGMAMTWAKVSDATIRSRVQTIVERVTDRLIADSWWIIDGQGHLTNPTPVWELGLMRLALSVNPTKYSGIGYDGQYTLCLLLQPHTDDKHKSDYFVYNLDFCIMGTLRLLETNADKRDTYTSWLGHAFKDDAKDHLNAEFSAVFQLANNDPYSACARGTLQGGLYDFPMPPRWLTWVDSGSLYLPWYDTDHATVALLPRDRPQTDFLWQRSPTLLRGGVNGVSCEYPGLDVILPYWMGRAAGVIPTP